jgi:putative iron-regulated protein
VQKAIAALVAQTTAIESAAKTLGIQDLNPDTADHSF